MIERPEPSKKSRGSRRWLLILLLLLVVFLGLWLFLDGHHEALPGGSSLPSPTADTVGVNPATMTTKDSIVRVKDSLPRQTPVSQSHGKTKVAVRPHDTIRNPDQPIRDTTTSAQISPESDTDSATFDTASSQADPCGADTIPLWVYPDPSGGLHRKSVAVLLIANKSAAMEWRLSTSSAWRPYADEGIRLDSTADLYFRGRDTCGRMMDERVERYEIDPSTVIKRCSPGMEFIKVGGAAFCIDRYEWPNMKGKIPAARVSLYQAMDSCASQGKRLCTSEEWSIACAGPYSWTFPYGQIYEPRACITVDTMVRASASKPECRGYFEVYDMSGNLNEWTSSRSVANASFNNVMGGFWGAGAQSSCSTQRYSYFSQNRHNPVGFRCCSNSGPSSMIK